MNGFDLFEYEKNLILTVLNCFNNLQNLRLSLLERTDLIFQRQCPCSAKVTK